MQGTPPKRRSQINCTSRKHQPLLASLEFKKISYMITDIYKRLEVVNYIWRRIAKVTAFSRFIKIPWGLKEGNASDVKNYLLRIILT